MTDKFLGVMDVDEDGTTRLILELQREVERLRADIETWGRVWNDAELLAARVEALKDGTADLGRPKE
jgi:hypothetical protein